AHDLHVQEAQETTAKAETQRFRRLGFEGDRRVIQFQLVERIAQVRQVVTVDRVDTAKDHGLGAEVAAQGHGRSGRLGDRLARTSAADVLDAGDDVADLAGSELGDADHVGGANPDLFDLVV